MKKFIFRGNSGEFYNNGKNEGQLKYFRIFYNEEPLGEIMDVTVASSTNDNGETPMFDQLVGKNLKIVITVEDEE